MRAITRRGFAEMPAREARPDVAMVQLATRIPQPLPQRVRIWSINHDMPIMEFVEVALREALENATASRR